MELVEVSQRQNSDVFLVVFLVSLDSHKILGQSQLTNRKFGTNIFDQRFDIHENKVTVFPEYLIPVKHELMIFCINTLFYQKHLVLLANVHVSILFGEVFFTKL